MRDRLNYRFPVTELLVTSALLDPRCKDLAVVNDYLMEQNISKLEFLAKQVKDNIRESNLKISQPAISDNVESSTAKKTTAQELIELSRKHTVGGTSRSAAVEKECQLYFASAHAEDVLHNDILKFWKERRVNFPWLSTAVRKFLCIQATSTPCERLFSICGLIYSAKRNRLQPERLDKTCFIHDNYERCKRFIHTPRSVLV